MIQVPNWKLWSVLFDYAIKQILNFWHIIPIGYSSGTGHMYSAGRLFLHVYLALQGLDAICEQARSDLKVKDWYSAPSTVTSIINDILQTGTESRGHVQKETF
jgi:hypothetical protein